MGVMSKHTLVINWLEDTHTCDTCGDSFATGAKVLLDGEVIVDKKAHAHCYSGSGDVDLAGILLIALEKLGVDIVEEGNTNDLDYYRGTCT